MTLARSAIRRTSRLLIIGLVGWLWFLSSKDWAWRAVSFIAVLAFAALTGIAWYVFRARADRRWRTALNRYSEQELTKRH